MSTTLKDRDDDIEAIREWCGPWIAALEATTVATTMKAPDEAQERRTRC